MRRIILWVLFSFEYIFLELCIRELLSYCVFYMILLAILVLSKPFFLQVCDFGLSRLKHNTFLSSKSTAGTVRIWENLYRSFLRHMQHVLSAFYISLTLFFQYISRSGWLLKFSAMNPQMKSELLFI